MFITPRLRVAQYSSCHAWQIIAEATRVNVDTLRD
jgi:hypothetical protein